MHATLYKGAKNGPPHTGDAIVCPGCHMDRAWLHSSQSGLTIPGTV